MADDQIQIAALAQQTLVSMTSTAPRRRRERTKKNATESLQGLADDSNVWTAPDPPEAAVDDEESPPEEALTARSARNARAGGRRDSAAAAATRAPPKQRGGGKKKNKSNACLKDDPELKGVLARARYESRVDPYRGLAPLFWSHGGDAPPAELQDVPSPWGTCAKALEATSIWKFSSGPEVVHLDGEGGQDEEAAAAVECGCPAVDRWARDELAAHRKEEAAKKKKAARGRKRKKSNADEEEKSGEEGEDVVMIDGEGEGDGCEGSKESRLFCGERKGGHKPSCPCDYNPFCLASLGGLVDRHRQSAAKVKHTAGEATPPKLLPEMIRDNLTAALSAPLQNAESGKDADSGTLRRSIVVDNEALVKHGIRFLGGDGRGGTCQGVEAMHERLVFRADGDEPVANGKVKLSTPPGLRNLGATCYLNSQLQCLAQNLGFAHGLFSWRKPPFDTGSEVEKRMATVLSHMQNILARMRYGPDRVICTNEFASALSLENDEMQDPNEFARLLFDRMQESFRQSAAISPESFQSGLGELLPSVFGGIFANVTECFECGKNSERKEDFMDLTVPIIDAEEETEEQPKKGKRAKKSSVGDTDVQQCLDAYLRAESLTGDNKYDCSRCQKKCDATRRVVFAKLPPVLNIQLARYVFDKETFSKRKLSTKVLLPRSLEIPADSMSEGVQQREYVLCAVQNHLGTSAHGGHYVADVLDWTTGVWYEFNDEDATVLDRGPTSSFDPVERGSDREATNGSKSSKVTGSEDAYNLFYVDKAYLAEQCERELEKFSKHSGEKCEILADMAVQRDAKYRLERENQRKEMLKNTRLQVRQQHCLEKLFQSASNLAVTPDSEGKKVWIDGLFLRRFLSCQDGLEDIFRNTSATFLKSEDFLCEHQKLAPRTARRGKLLHLDVYDAVESTLRAEYGQFLRDQESDLFLDSADSVTLMDQKMVCVDDDDFACKECGLMYQQEARRKVELFELLLSIHDDLLPGENDLDRRSISEPSSVYVISRTFATSLRTYVEKKVKELKSMAQRTCADKAKSEDFCGGLDTLDLSEVQLPMEDALFLWEGATREDAAEAGLGLLKGEDPTSKITCKHDCCPVMNTGNSVRLIPSEVWEKLAEVFPNAVPHQFQHPKDDAVGNCARCYNEKEGANVLTQRLKEWKGKITQQGPLRDLRGRGKKDQFYPSDTIGILLQTPGSGGVSLHALHHLDVMRWRDAFAAVERYLKSKKKEPDAIKTQLNELLFALSEESQGREWKIRSLVCNEHNMALCLPPLTGEEDAKSWLGMLPESNVELLLEEEYRELMASLSSLETTIHGRGSDPRAIGVPTVSIRCRKGKLAIKIDPHQCSSGCQPPTFEDECAEDGKILSKSQQPKQSKPAKGPEPAVEAPKGPLCRALVHEIDSKMDIEVAASMIQNDVENDKLSHSSTGRPRRSRQARGGSEGGFPVYEIEMALDGNLAHFRLLLHQSKGKELAGQRLFLLHSSRSKEQVTELDHGCNLKTLQEIIFGEPPSDDAATELPEDCPVNLILSYAGTGRNGRRMSREEREEEDHLLASLTEMQSLGWKDGDGSEVGAGGKKAKRRRQERGFQGTFLQSSSEMTGNGASSEKSAEVPEQTKDEQGASHSMGNAEAPEQPPQDSSGPIVIVDTPVKCKSDDNIKCKSEDESTVEASVKSNGSARPTVQADDSVDSRLAKAYEKLLRSDRDDAKEHIISVIEARLAD